MKNNIHKKLTIALLIFFAFRLIFHFLFLNIYIDEIGLRFSSGRFLLDNYVGSLLYACDLNTFGFTQPSIFLIPYYTIQSLFSFPTSPLGLRLWSTIILSFFIILLYWRTFRNQYFLLLLITVLLSGSLFANFMQFRSESFLIIGVILLLIFNDNVNSGWKVYANYFLLTIAITFFFASSLKNIFYLPFLIYYLHLKIQKKFLLVIFSVYSLIVGIFVYTNYSSRFQCSNTQLLEVINNQLNLNFSLITTDWKLFQSSLISSFLDIASYREGLFFSSNYSLNRFFPYDNQFLLNYGNIFNFLILLFLMIILFYFFIIGKNSEKKLIVLFLVSTITLHTVSVWKTAYHIKHYLVIYLLLLSMLFNRNRVTAILNSFIVFFAFFQFLIQFFVVYQEVNHVNQLINKKEYAVNWSVANLSPVPILFDEFFRETETSIKDSVKKKCNISNHKSYQNIILDDLTYYYFSKTSKPLYFLYTVGFWAGDNEKTRFFESANYGGFVLSNCSKKDLPNFIKLSNDFCCLNKEKNSK